MAVLVEYSQKLQQAVDKVISPLGYSVRQGKRERGRSALDERHSGYGGGSEYNGFFKITYSENRIKIANALTCFVNNTKTSVYGGADFYPTISGDEYDYQMGVSDDWLKSKHAICLKFLASSTSSRTSTGLWVIDGTELPDNSDSEVWYMLGIIDVGGTVQQIHTSGYPRLLWLYRCVNE